ncbi:MAG: thermonuclease family protein [Peptostreptococcaceae bacterium]
MIKFDRRKKKSILLSLVIGTMVIISGCTNTSTNGDSNTDFNISSTNKKPHISSIQVPLDTRDNNKSVIKATVDRVVDGDTVEIILPDGSEVDTRLLLIDTPETKHPEIGVQEYGPEASEFAKTVLHEGDTVYFELDGKSKTDKYGRYLGYLWYTCDDHNTLEMYNERVVEEGLARVGYIYDQTKHLDALLKTEETAKTNKLNIWSIPGYVTDKGYDMDKVNNPSTDNTTKEEQANDKTSGQINVYVNVSSKVYHKESNSHGMKSSEKMSKSQAESKGYKACSKCF